MNLSLVEWNETLWNIVRNRFHNKGYCLFLCFDDHVLNQALDEKGLDLCNLSPTEALNLTIQKHCRQLSTGNVGLRESEDGFARRENWKWVLEPQESGVSLAMTFVTQQILAAEKMQGSSFYTAYWEALGLDSDETRKNPFGDQGKKSFRALWGQLKRELKTVLEVDDRAITFRYGFGMNKYRNLPVSQSLLNERDLREVMSGVHQIEEMGDQALYAAIRRQKVSKSATNKIFNASLQRYVLAQVRDFASRSADIEILLPQPSTHTKADRPGQPVFRIYEEVEFFGDSTFYCSYIDEQVGSKIGEWLETQKLILFQVDEGEIASTSQTVLLEEGETVFLLGSTSAVEEFIRTIDSLLGDFSGSSMFHNVSLSLSGGYSLIRCLSVPAEVIGLDILSGVVTRDRGDASDIDIRFRGGICVNKTSNSYILGYGPTQITSGGVLVESAAQCQIDAQDLDIQSALKSLSESKVPCRHKFQLGSRTIFLELVDVREFTRMPVIACNTWCILPESVARSTVGNQKFTDYQFHEDVYKTMPKILASNRYRITAMLAVSLTKRKSRRVKVDSDQIDRCLTLLSYVDLPENTKFAISRKALLSNTVPWTLYTESQKNSKLLSH
jgi:hypothetical protein